MTSYQDRRVRDWSGLSPEDKVVVTEPGRQGYAATIDTKTADRAVSASGCRTLLFLVTALRRPRTLSALLG